LLGKGGKGGDRILGKLRGKIFLAEFEKKGLGREERGGTGRLQRKIRWD